MVPEKIPVSVVIIAHNEEARLPKCLDSLRDFDDIVLVVDSRTTDRTARIAGEFGCRVFEEEWKGFGPQKQSGIEKCGNDYVLILDADERLTPEAVRTVRELFRGPLADAYSFKRKSYIGKRWIRHCGWWPDRITRLFDRRKGTIEGAIHEKAVIKGKTAALYAVIEHYSFNDYSHMLQKLDSYTSCTSMELYRLGRRVSIFSPVTHGLWMFFRTFVLKRGFMDGLDGLVVSALSAGGAFFKYAKYIEMERFRRKGLEE